jgi:hypothetical protein
MNTSIMRLPLIPVIALVAVAAGIGLLVANTNYSWQGFLLVAAGLGIVAFIVIPRLARLESSGMLVRVLGIALLAKFAFAMIRYWFAFGVYGGIADAGNYSYQGQLVAHYIRNLDFAPLGYYAHFGTRFVELFTGIIYTFTGPSIYGGYLVYAFIAFLGSYFFYRAFEVAFPYGNKKLFLILIFFFPSLLYWPNGIGKDALIALFIGLTAYGTALFVRSHKRGLVMLIVGLSGTLCIRPFIVPIFAAALGLALVVYIFGSRTTGKALHVVGLVAVVAAIWLLLPVVATFIRAEEFTPQALISSFMQQQDYSYQGGSAFQVIDITDPFSFPVALLTMPFRPFPWDAHNLQALVQAIEGFLLLCLVAWRIRNVGRALSAIMADPYMCFILVSIAGLLVGFSSIANYGILVRERAMMLPFVLMLLAYDRPPAVPETGRQPVPRLNIASAPMNRKVV